MKKKGFAIVVSVFLMGAFSLFASKAYLAKEEPCSLACPNPGGPSGCEPLGIRLELNDPKVQSKWIHTLWYRVTLENRTCNGLFVDGYGLADTNDFEDNERNGRLLRFRIWDPSGKEVKPVTQFEQVYDAYYPIRPYVVDTKAEPRLRDVTHVNRRIDLGPGESISTNPSVLRPQCHKLPHTDEYLADMKSVGTSKALKNAKEMVAIEAARCQAEARKHKPKKPAPPPPGFRLLQQYAFSKPGTYRIQALYDDETVGFRRYPRMESLPNVFTFILSLAEVITRIPFMPHPKSDSYQIHATSKIHEFTVTQ